VSPGWVGTESRAAAALGRRGSQSMTYDAAGPVGRTIQRPVRMSLR
jgi:hypothetical protein